MHGSVVGEGNLLKPKQKGRSGVGKVADADNVTNLVAAGFIHLGRLVKSAIGLRALQDGRQEGRVSTKYLWVYSHVVRWSR